MRLSWQDAGKRARGVYPGQQSTFQQSRTFGGRATRGRCGRSGYWTALHSYARSAGWIGTSLVRLASSRGHSGRDWAHAEPPSSARPTGRVASSAMRADLGDLRATRVTADAGDCPGTSKRLCQSCQLIQPMLGWYATFAASAESPANRLTARRYSTLIAPGNVQGRSAMPAGFVTIRLQVAGSTASLTELRGCPPSSIGGLGPCSHLSAKLGCLSATLSKLKHLRGKAKVRADLRRRSEIMAFSYP
jgi:hypothetical protein